MFEAVTGALVTFREGFESMLLVALMSGIFRKNGIRRWNLLLGLLIGMAGSSIIGWQLYERFDGEPWFDPAMTLMTALVLTYVVVWNARVQSHVREHVDAIDGSDVLMVTMVTAGIFLREGTEMVLMLWSIAKQDPVQLVLGMLVGIMPLLLLWRLMGQSLVTGASIGRLFRYSNIILALIAAWFYVDAVRSAIPLLAR